MVRRRLSSRTEFRDSIHSGSISPSQMIHDCTSINHSQINIYTRSINYELISYKYFIKTNPFWYVYRYFWTSNWYKRFCIYSQMSLSDLNNRMKVAIPLYSIHTAK
jgi:hypothetical protein